MSFFADLHRTVQATLASKRLGQPVFIRCTLHGGDKPDALIDQLTRLAAAVREWMAQPLKTVFATGKSENGQVTLTLRFAEGTTAQLSYATGRPRGDGLDLMILGNRGAAYHDSGAANLWDEPMPLGDGAPNAKLRETIEQALKSGKPQTFVPEGNP